MNSPVQQARYPLGTDQEEFERLHLQHRLWSDAAVSLWKRAGIAPGSRVLDVGAGPGAASFDLAQLATSSGHVLAVDESASFIEHITREARARNMSQLVATVGDAQRLETLGAQSSSFDIAYARWLLCFTPRPHDVVRGIAPLLKPGGMLCIHDYFNYTVMTAAPRRPSYTRMVEATAQSWRDSGGDPDVMGKLPRILHDRGFDLVHLEVHQRIARPGDTMWQWARTWWRSYAPKLVKMGYLDEHARHDYESDVDAMTREHDFLMLPPVFEIMARRR
ncbi:MAG: hypothetical protein NVS3B20_14980 [Polyangiales bacterium]